MKRKEKKKLNKEGLKQDSINFYRVQGATMAFIEFLNMSNNCNEIVSMWRWLKSEFEENGVEDRIIFPFFKNVGEWGYDTLTLSSKLIDSLMIVDWDELEVGWLQSQFAILHTSDPIPELSKNDYFKMQGATMAVIESLYFSNDERHIHHLWSWLMDEFHTNKIDVNRVFEFFKMAQNAGCDIEALSSKLISVLLDNRTDNEDDTPEWLASAFGSPYFNNENTKPNKV